MSTIFCGRGMTVRFCTPGGVTLVVAVVFALSFDCWQPDTVKSRAQHATAAARENFGNVMMVLQKAGKDIQVLDFHPLAYHKKRAGNKPCPTICGVSLV